MRKTMVTFLGNRISVLGRRRSGLIRGLRRQRHHTRLQELSGGRGSDVGRPLLRQPVSRCRRRQHCPIQTSRQHRRVGPRGRGESGRGAASSVPDFQGRMVRRRRRRRLLVVSLSTSSNVLLKRLGRSLSPESRRDLFERKLGFGVLNLNRRVGGVGRPILVGTGQGFHIELPTPPIDGGRSLLPGLMVRVARDRGGPEIVFVKRRFRWQEMKRIGGGGGDDRGHKSRAHFPDPRSARMSRRRRRRRRCRSCCGRRRIGSDSTRCKNFNHQVAHD
ncbi:hypothetical protein TorRG33x02_238460 [Trema orientale]|uniref:Uncharacterized protein n=1 Tax=Trema orientale TaxID=63057 RepID=A0A2P5DY75_TREOI|nr:hypothetical protein TorRG33x02_238460 [Trema orientale]